MHLLSALYVIHIILYKLPCYIHSCQIHSLSSYINTYRIYSIKNWYPYHPVAFIIWRFTFSFCHRRIDHFVPRLSKIYMATFSHFSNRSSEGEPVYNSDWSVLECGLWLWHIDPIKRWTIEGNSTRYDLWTLTWSNRTINPVETMFNLAVVI